MARNANLILKFKHFMAQNQFPLTLNISHTANLGQLSKFIINNKKDLYVRSLFGKHCIVLCR